MFLLTVRWIFLLIYVALITIGNAQTIFRFQCPEGCLCVPDNTDQLLLTCRWPKIHSFNEIFPRNITKSLAIYCTNKQIENDLKGGVFNRFDKLQELRISNCKLNTLNSEIFAGLQNIRGLHLHEVSTKPLTLSKEFLAPMKLMERLTIINSNLENIEEDALCPLKYLQILNVTQNRLRKAATSAEVSECVLDHLIVYDMSANQIEHLDAQKLKMFPSLRQLRLNSNNLNVIDNDAFKDTKFLQHLNLDGNNLFEMVPLPDSLTFISLAHNRFTTIPASVANLLSLISLNISGNLIDSTTPFSLLSTSIEFLDLSNNQMSDIPLKLFRESMATIATLIMANNNISEIAPNALQNFTNLKELDLSKNKITSLRNGLFHGLNELTKLYMNNNHINHVDIEVFNDLEKRLMTLSLANNRLTELPMAIARLHKIKYVDLSENRISTMYKFVLNKIHHLTRLDLTNNNLTDIDSYIFSDALHMSELILRGNNIVTIKDDAFDKCPELETIDLSANKIHQWGECFKNLPSLRSLNVSGNELQFLDWGKLPSQLIELYANNNAIRNIQTVTDSNVKIIHLRANNLQTIESEQLPSLLEEIDLSKNELKQILKHSFTGKSQLKYVNLQNNKLKTIPHGLFHASEVINNNLPGRLYIGGNPLICSCEMAWIVNSTLKQMPIEIVDVAESKCVLPISNDIVSIQDVSEESYLCRYSKTCEPTCICCQFENCDCKSKCPDSCECFRDSQHKLNIVKCEPPTGKRISIRELPMFASHIYLNNTNIPVLRSHDFIGRTRLSHLYIVLSGLQTIEPLAFNTLPKLQILDLSGNELQRINGDESFKTQRLQKLNIDNNNIVEIDRRLAEIMPNLEELRAANNAMKTLPDYLTTDAAHKLKFISLGGNPFRCDCSSTRQFQVQQWFQPNQNRLLDADKVHCVENVTEALMMNDFSVLTSFAPNNNYGLFSVPMVDFLYHENRSLCAVKAEGFFGGTFTQNILLISFLATVLIIIVIGLFYVFLSSSKDKCNKTYGSQTRFKMASSMTSSADQIQGYSPLPSDATNYFDMFISYSKDDENDVLEELCRPLEARHSSIFLLHRDGKFNCNEDWQSVSDELNHQVQACQTLIMYITKRFLEKEWKTVQIKMAHYLFARSAEKKLIAILSEDIDLNDLNRELGKILRKKTIIQRRNPLFWRLLESEILSGRSSVGSDTSQTYSGTYDCIVPSEIV